MRRCGGLLRREVLEAMMSPVSLAVTTILNTRKGGSEVAVFGKIAVASMRASLNRTGHERAVVPWQPRALIDLIGAKCYGRIWRKFSRLFGGAVVCTNGQVSSKHTRNGCIIYLNAFNIYRTLFFPIFKRLFNSFTRSSKCDLQ